MPSKNETRCDFCKRPIAAMINTFTLGRWVLHYDCYRIIIKRLKLLTDILLSSEDKFDEWLNEALHLVANQE